jgi:hypothetical protein
MSTPLTRAALLPAPRRPLLLAGSLALAGIIALSIHVWMLSAGVPFPLSRPPLWARWLNQSIVFGAVFAFLKLSHPIIGHRSLLSQALITAVVLLAIQETLRAAIMTGVVGTGWVYSMGGLLRPLLGALIFAFLGVIAVRWTRNGISWVIVALATAAVYLAAQTFVGHALAPFTEHLASLARPAGYAFPYPFHVSFMAYLTFVEPIVGATLVTMLVWDRLPAQGDSPGGTRPDCRFDEGHRRHDVALRLLHGAAAPARHAQLEPVPVRVSCTRTSGRHRMGCLRPPNPST